MAKRFTDSEKFRKPWYRSLSPKHKCLWEYFLSECNIAGIMDLDLQAMSFHIGEEITMQDIEFFSEKVFFLTNDKIFIPKFVQFQQKELNEKNNAHKNIIKLFEKYNIPVTLDMKDFKSPCEGASEPLPRGTGNSNSNSNGISNSNLKKKSEKNETQKPDDVSLPVWDDFVKLRKSKKAVISETVLSKIRTEGKKINWTLEQCLEQMVFRNWQGFEAKWMTNDGESNGKNGRNNAKQSIVDEADEAMRRVNEEYGFI